METGTRGGGLTRLVGAIVVAGSCASPKPRPLDYGAESCTQCHMTLADPRFGAELVLTTGKPLPFDDPGCLATYLVSERVPAGRVASLWVSDFLPPYELVEVREAVFLVSDAIRTPMDHRVAAFRSRAAADSVQAALGRGGRLVPWDSVLAVVEGEPGGPGGRGGPDARGAQR